MRVYLLLPLLFTSLLASACSGREQVASENATPFSTQAVFSPTPEANLDILTPSPETAVDAGVGDQTQNRLVSECTLVSSSAEESSAYGNLFAITETDWSLGPEDAAVTLIEYGDFQ